MPAVARGVEQAEQSARRSADAGEKPLRSVARRPWPRVPNNVGGENRRRRRQPRAAPSPARPTATHKPPAAAGACRRRRPRHQQVAERKRGAGVAQNVAELLDGTEAADVEIGRAVVNVERTRDDELQHKKCRDSASWRPGASTSAGGRAAPLAAPTGAGSDAASSAPRRPRRGRRAPRRAEYAEPPPAGPRRSRGQKCPSSSTAAPRRPI